MAGASLKAFKTALKRNEWNLIWGALLLMSFVLRVALNRYASGDMNGSSLPRLKELVSTGFAGASPFIWPISYDYMLMVASKTAALLPRIFPAPQVFAIKLNSILCDYLCAYVVYRLVRLKHSRGELPKLAAVFVLFAPTVVLDGAFLGQWDIMYTTAVLAAVLFLALDRPWAVVLCLGLAFSMKLQCLFLAPLFFTAMLRGRLKPWQLLAIPGVFIALAVPGILAGRPAMSALGAYALQMGEGIYMSVGVANFYSWIPDKGAEGHTFIMLQRSAIIVAAAASLLASFALYRSKERLSAENLMKWGVFFAMLLPFLLQKMHERYFFMADVLFIPLAFCLPEFIPVAVLQTLASLMADVTLLWGEPFMPLKYVSLVQFAALVWATHLLWRSTAWDWSS